MLPIAAGAFHPIFVHHPKKVRAGKSEYTLIRMRQLRADYAAATHCFVLLFFRGVFSLYNAARASSDPLVAVREEEEEEREESQLSSGKRVARGPAAGGDVTRK